MYTWVIQKVSRLQSLRLMFSFMRHRHQSRHLQCNTYLEKSLIQPPFPDNIPTVPTSLKKSALFEIGIQSLIIWFPYILSESQ